MEVGRFQIKAAKTAAAVLLCVLAVFCGSAYADGTYNAAENSVTLDASGYNTVIIKNSENGRTVYMDQNPGGFSASEKFLLKTDAAVGNYAATLGGKYGTKQIGFSIGKKYPYTINTAYVSENSLEITAVCDADISGIMFFCLYNTDGSLKTARNAEIGSDKTAKCVFEEYSDEQTLKILLWENIQNLTPLSDVYTAVLENILPPQRTEVLQVASDGNIIDKDGNMVELRGVNFGGWLIQENWMCPVLAFNSSVTVKDGTENGWANLDTLNEMEQRFGTEKTRGLFEAYEDNYITEWDFGNVKNLGFNCVRIPFWYRNFMSDEDGTYLTDDDNENPGFKRLDWVCDMADKYGLYVIFDMHGCPGGQNGDHSSGETGRNYLYTEEKYQNIMEELWAKIAARYRGRECVAAYDIMNEPGNNADAAHGVAEKYRLGVWSDKTARNAVYDRMISAIRSADPEHIITVEGIWRLEYLPSDPSARGWTNIMYQLHSYDADISTVNTLISSMKAAKQKGIAVFMGEFNPKVYNSTIVSLMQSEGISYTLWNYKTTGLGADNSAWGLYSRTYGYNDLYEMSANAAPYIPGTWAQSGNVMFHLGNVPDDEYIKELYTNWWSAKWLGTDNGFTVNTELAGYMRQ